MGELVEFFKSYLIQVTGRQDRCVVNGAIFMVGPIWEVILEYDLAHCQKIVELHRGKIWVQSELGEGIIFYFGIPIQ